MNELDIESDVRDFYQSLSAPADRVEAILDARDLVVAARRWKKIATVSSAGLAVMTLIAISMYFNTQPNVNESSNLVEKSPRFTTPDQSAPPKKTLVQDGRTAQESASAVTTPEPVIVESPYRIVAFRSHGDGCPHCRATGNVYRELQKSLHGSPLDFDQFDFSSDRRAEMRRLANLNLAAIVEGRIETAFLVLTTSDGTVMKEFKPSQGALHIAKQVHNAVGQ